MTERISVPEGTTRDAPPSDVDVSIACEAIGLLKYCAKFDGPGTVASPNEMAAAIHRIIRELATTRAQRDEARARIKDAWSDLEEHFIQRAPVSAQRQWMKLAHELWVAIDDALAARPDGSTEGV